MAPSDAGKSPCANGFKDTSGNEDDGDGFPTPSQKNADDEASVRLLRDEAHNSLCLSLSRSQVCGSLFFLIYCDPHFYCSLKMMISVNINMTVAEKSSYFHFMEFCRHRLY